MSRTVLWMDHGCAGQQLVMACKRSQMSLPPPDSSATVPAPHSLAILLLLQQPKKVSQLRPALDAKYGVSDTNRELYIMEQFHDYIMTNGCSIVEQPHEIHVLVKKLKNFSCVLPEKFEVGCIIAKLS